MRRMASILQIVAGSAACALAAAYGVSRALTDRTHLTQYFFWTPSVAYLVGMAGLLGMALVFARLARPQRSRSTRRARVWPQRLPALALVLMLVHVAFAEWHCWRYVAGVAPAKGATVRVMHWNMTYAVPYWWDKYIAAIMTAPKPDVLIVSNPTHEGRLDELAAALGPEYTAKRCGIFGVFTRLRVIEAAAATLEIPGTEGNTAAPPGMPGEEDPKTEYLPEWSPIPRAGSNIYDPGHACCVRLDARDTLGREIVIWGVDMPSDPWMWRMASARAAAKRLDELEARPAGSSGRFLKPDIIVGDCNTPRGSASLRVIGRGYPHAFDQASRGHMATWPSEWPVFHIDQMFIGPGLRAVTYRTLDMGINEIREVSDHRSQVAEITTSP